MRRTQRLVEKCRVLMAGGAWWTIAQMALVLGCSEYTASARIRDQRKKRYGGHRVVKRPVPGGFEYRMEPGKARLGRSFGDLLDQAGGDKAIGKIIGREVYG